MHPLYGRLNRKRVVLLLSSFAYFFFIKMIALHMGASTISYFPHGGMELYPIGTAAFLICYRWGKTPWRASKRYYAAMTALLLAPDIYVCQARNGDLSLRHPGAEIVFGLMAALTVVWLVLRRREMRGKGAEVMT